MITFVYAQDQEGGIGYNNQLPWHLPNDLAFFKKITLGQIVLMGRKTFDSMNQKPLPKRHNLILTRDFNYSSIDDNVQIVHKVEEVLALAEVERIMVIGGAEIFSLFLPYVSEIIRTEIFQSFDCDTFMPEIDFSKWELVKTESGKFDEKNTMLHEFQWWKKREELSCVNGI